MSDTLKLLREIQSNCQLLIDNFGIEIDELETKDDNEGFDEGDEVTLGGARGIHNTALGIRLKIDEFFRTKEKDMSIDIAQKIDYEMYSNLIITALEGGSNYWYLLKITKDERLYLESKYKELNAKGALTEMIAYASYHNPAFVLAIYDVEEPEEKIGELSKENIVKGLMKAASENSEEFQDLVNDNLDAGSADTLFQLITLGEVTFG